MQPKSLRGLFAAPVLFQKSNNLNLSTRPTERQPGIGEFDDFGYLLVATL
jgi:hypothetical protein